MHSISRSEENGKVPHTVIKVLDPKYLCGE